MPVTPARPQPADPRTSLAWIQETVLLDTTLTRIIRYATQMQGDLDDGKLNIAFADQLGRSVLTALREAASISARAGIAAEPAA